MMRMENSIPHITIVHNMSNNYNIPYNTVCATANIGLCTINYHVITTANKDSYDLKFR
jgi:hypothetical protein